MWPLKATLRAAKVVVGIGLPVGVCQYVKKDNFVTSIFPQVLADRKEKEEYGRRRSKSAKAKSDKRSSSGNPHKSIKPIETASKKPEPVVAPLKPKEVPPTIPGPPAAICLPRPTGNLIRSKPDNVLTISYNRHHKQANWVFEELTRCSIEGCCEGTPPYKEDLNVKEEFRTTRRDFAMCYGDYETVQLAAPGNHINNPVGMEDCYFMSNVVPMNSILKNETWHNFEQFIRVHFIANSCNTFIFTGPLYKPKYETSNTVEYGLISDKHIPVPTHFFKIIGFKQEDGKEYYVAYVFPNEPFSLCEAWQYDLFRNSLENIDNWSGFDFSTTFKRYTEWHYAGYEPGGQPSQDNPKKQLPPGLQPCMAPGLEIQKRTRLRPCS